MCIESETRICTVQSDALLAHWISVPAGVFTLARSDISVPSFVAQGVPAHSISTTPTILNKAIMAALIAQQTAVSGCVCTVQLLVRNCTSCSLCGTEKVQRDSFLSETQQPVSRLSQGTVLHHSLSLRVQVTRESRIFGSY